LRHLEAAGIDFVVNPRLVRGLDYYSRTVFEWVTTDLGSQDAVCSGGRTTGSCSNWAATVPAIGWALGEERIVELMRLQQLVPAAGRPTSTSCWRWAARAVGLELAERMRNAAPACVSRRIAAAAVSSRS
jgi:histidyl-tRNA synthetase